MTAVFVACNSLEYIPVLLWPSSNSNFISLAMRRGGMTVNFQMIQIFEWKICIKFTFSERGRQ